MRIINNLSIGKRLIILVSFAFAVIIATALIGMTNNHRLSKEINLGYQAITRPLAAVANARGEFNAMRTALYDLAYDFNTNEQNLRFKEQVMQNLNDYERNINLYKETLDVYGTNDPYEKEAVDYLTGQLIPLREHVEHIVSIAVITGYEAEIVRMLRGDFLEVAEDISMDLAALTEILEAQVNEENVKASNLNRENNIINITIMTTGAVILLSIAYLTVLSITKPLKEMASVAERLSEGKMDVNIAYRSRNELGVLADSFRRLTYSVTGIISDMQIMAEKQSGGDIEHFIDTEGYQESYLDMVRGVNEMMMTAIDDIKTIVDYLQNLTGGGHVTKMKRFPGKKSVISDSIDELTDKVHYDMLTGIYNRRYMEESLNRVVKIMQRSGGDYLSVLMIDIDYFKRFNDTYGHTAGDDCLRIVAKVLNDSVMRDDDFAARYGGEEFTVILPNTDAGGACMVAERILNNVRERNIPHEKNDACNYVTVSIGVFTSMVQKSHNGIEFIKNADKALYASKENGRNRYTCYDLVELQIHA